MPRPPPPATAFSITAPPSPSSAKKARACSFVTGPCEPANTGIPQRMASRRAAVLSPNSSSVSGAGPMKTTPASAHIAANAAFSLRKP